MLGVDSSEQKRKILTVDDDPVNNEIIKDILEDYYEVKSVCSGQECLDTLQHYHPEMILTDVMMPDMDGYELCRRLKSNPDTRDIKILHVSAFTQMEGRIKCYELGTDDFISRPFHYKEFLAKIRVHMGLRSQQEIERLKSDVLQVFSHETRTPLNAVINGAQLLAVSEHLSDEDKEYVKIISDGGNRLLSLVEKAQFYFELYQGDYTPQLHPHNFHNYLMEWIEVWRTKEPSVQFELPEITEWKDTLFDVGLIRWVFDALIGNAVKYGASQGNIKVGLHLAAGEWGFSVENEGSQIPEGNGLYLFEPFTSDPTAIFTKGHGLSLAIAKKIVSLHRGTIVGKNLSENAVQFSLVLPGVFE